MDDLVERLEALARAEHDDFSVAQEAAARIKELEGEVENACVEYWLYHNPDTGTEVSENHPVESGEVPDAEGIRRATAHALIGELQDCWRRITELEKDNERLRKRNNVLAAHVSRLTSAGDRLVGWVEHEDYRLAQSWEEKKQDALAALKGGTNDA